jgi:chromosomal replication initiation ATPase DnaA
MDKMKGLFFSENSNEEIPEAKLLAPDPDRILKTVAEFYKMEKDDLLKSRRGYFNEPRNVAIYLMRRLRGDTLKEAGKVFGIRKNSTVSSSISGVKQAMKRNKGIRVRIEKLIQILTEQRLIVDLTPIHR